MRTEIFFPYTEKIGKYYAVNTFDASTWLAHRELKYCLHRHIKNYCVRLTIKDNGSCVMMPHKLYLLKLKFVSIWSGKYEHLKANNS